MFGDHPWPQLLQLKWTLDLSRISTPSLANSGTEYRFGFLISDSVICASFLNNHYLSKAVPQENGYNNH
jgi:hypothetical protein